MRRDFQSEIEEAVTAQARTGKTAEDKFRRGITAWINYFVQYTGIFELFFLERIGEGGTRSDIADLIYNSIVPAVEPGFDQLVEDKKNTPDEASIKLDTIRFQVTGLLLYYSNRKNPADYGSLIEMLNRTYRLSPELKKPAEVNRQQAAKFYFQ